MYSTQYVYFCITVVGGVMFFGRGCALVRIRVSIEFEKEKKIYIPEKKIG